jgi:eukaryotic translation initiation factor 2C
LNNPLPKLTFIIVKKRHNTRFFVRDPNTGNINNVQPGRFHLYTKRFILFSLLGTIVDTDIVHPEGFDFYLNSHAALQGRFYFRRVDFSRRLVLFRNIKTNFISCFI